MKIPDPTAVADITPAMSAWMEEHDKPAFAKYEAAKAGLAALKAANGSTSNVLLQVTKLLLEVAPDSPQKSIVQDMHDSFEASPAKPSIAGKASPEPAQQPEPVVPLPEPPQPESEPQPAPEPPPVDDPTSPPAAPEPVKLTAVVQNSTSAKSEDGATYTFTWDSITGATSYDTERWDGANWIPIASPTTNSLTLPTAKLPPEATLYRIIAVNEAGRAENADGSEAWSADFTF